MRVFKSHFCSSSFTESSLVLSISSVCNQNNFILTNLTLGFISPSLGRNTALHRSLQRRHPPPAIAAFSSSNKVHFLFWYLANSWLSPPLCCIIRGNHKAGGVTVSGFEIYRSQLLRLQMGFLEPAEEKVFMLSTFLEIKSWIPSSSYIIYCISVITQNRLKTWLLYKLSVN